MKALFMTSLIMSIIIIFFFIHKKFRSRKFSSKMYYWIWIIIAIRLMFPFDISGENTIYNFSSPVPEHKYIDNEANSKITKYENKEENTYNEIIKNENKTNVTIEDRKGNIQDKLSKIWIVGVFIYFSYNLILYLLFKIRVQKSLSYAGEDIEIRFNTLKNIIIPNQNVSIKESKYIDSPMVMGLIKPTLLIPENINRKNIDYIFKHEFVHLKRRDIFYKLIIFFSTTIHWFNPVVHIMAKRAGEDLELSCDEEVTKDMDEEDRIKYSKTLIDSIALVVKSPICTTSFSGGKEMIKKRLDQILDKIKRKSGKPVIVLLAIFVLSTSLLIGCETKGKQNLTDELYSYRTEYVGDNSKVGNIVSRLEFPKEYNYKSMEILSKEESYGLKLYFDGNTNEADIDDFKYDSAILFSLVDNLDYITYIIVEENGEEIEKGTFTRDNIDSMTISVLGMKTSELGSSKNKFTKLVEFYEEVESEIKEDKDDISQIIEYNLNALAKKNSEADSKNYRNQNEYGDIVKLGEVGLEYILSEFENGNVQDDFKGQIMKDIAIEILGPKNNVENYRELSPTEWYKRLDIIDIVKIEDDSQVFEDKYEELVYKAHYPTKYKKEEDSFTAIALDVKGIYEKDNIIKIYAIVSKNLVVLYDDGKVIDDSGYLMPTVTVYEKKGDAYELIDVIQPRDGSEYAPSIKEMCKDKPMMAIKLMNIDYEKINEELRNNVITILKKNGHNNVNMEEF